MREGRALTLPESMPRGPALLFSITLLGAQLATGTDPSFAVLVFVFTQLAVTAFNRVGGFTTTLGVGIAMLALKIVIISQVAKVLFLQPADRYLEVPLVTIAVLTVGMASMLLGVMLARDVRHHAGWLPRITEPRVQLAGAIACSALALLSTATVLVGGFDAGSAEMQTGGVIGIARQFVFAAPLSVVFATAYTITRSEGRRSFSWLVALTMVLPLTFAASAASKQSFFEVLSCYALTCVAWRFRFRRVHAVVLALCAALGLLVVWPAMQAFKAVGVQTGATVGQRIELVLDLVSEAQGVSGFLDTKGEVEELFANERFQYYGRPVGWLERFSLIEQNDELVVATLQQGETGLKTITHAFEAMIPSFIHPDKPTRNTAGFLGKRIASIDEDDEDTQISFGIIAESFTALGWLGVLVIPCILSFAFANTTSRLAGTIYGNVWTVYLFGRIQHYFVENTISAFIQDMLVFSVLMYLVSVLVRFAHRALFGEPDTVAGP